MFKRIKLFLKLFFCDKKRVGYNLRLNEYETLTKKENLKSCPAVIAIGVTNLCNLKCRLCITGLGLQKKTVQHMDYDLFCKIIDKVKFFSPRIQLYKWGESLLHPRIADMFEYCNMYDLCTELSSNLSLRNIDDKLEAMVKYRLRHLIVSFDGITQEDYSRYRVGGDLNTVIRNMQYIQEMKRKYNSPYPKISLQFLKNKFTKNQIQIIEKKYLQWGADDYFVDDMTVIFKDRNKEYFQDWFEDKDINERRFLDVGPDMLGKICPFLYNIMTIEQDGSIPACCFCTDPKDDYSRFDDSKSIQQMFNSEKFISARKMFKKKKNLENCTCSDCSLFLAWCNR